MMGTIVRLRWLNLMRDRVALVLTFVLPVIFFSIFAWIFGGIGGGGGPSSLTVVIVDEDVTSTSARFVAALEDQDGLRISRAPRAREGETAPPPWNREDARRIVREGDAPAALIIPKGFGERFGRFLDADRAPVELIYDASNPMARPTVSGLVQAASMRAAPDVLLKTGLEYLDQSGGRLTAEQRALMEQLGPFLRGERSFDEFEGTAPGDVDVRGTPADGFEGLVSLVATEARADGNRETPPIVAYYAAGIGVMFLLFSMAGAGGSLLEEEEHGTIERVLSSRTGMGTLLAGSWLFFAVMGFVQIAVMFVWGALLFGLDLWTANHLAGFVAITVPTTAAAAGFGILLATISRTRAQLGGLSTIIILIMSALGGSMVPRFVMPEFMNTTALFTFNGWALDGYLKVFWHDDPGDSTLALVAGLAPQIAVLAALTVVFLLIARTAARRWETV